MVTSVSVHSDSQEFSSKTSRLDASSSDLRDGVLVLSGYGLRIAVERSHLIVEDGVGAHRRYDRFSRVVALRRLIVLGHSGTISLDALRWLRDIGAAFVNLDLDGRIIASSQPSGPNHPKLRRAQALAANNGVGLAIAKALIEEKLAAQLSVAERLPQSGDPAPQIDSARVAVQTASTSDELRRIEASGAVAYWEAWQGVPVRFARRDAKRVPDHWKIFGVRTSPLSGSQRRAVNPANAMLNYLYAILEAEARIAAFKVGLDPGLGVFHSDLPSRESLASDLMEPARPSVDEFVLDVLDGRAFRRADFFETREGVCRIMPPVSHLLAETALRWAHELAPITERVAQNLFETADFPGRPIGAATSWTERNRSTSKRRKLATHLTGTNRRAGQERYRRRPKPQKREARSRVPKTCATCGKPITSQKRYCLSCWQDQQVESMASAQCTLERRRASGDDPAHGRTAARKRGARNARQLRANAEWARSHGELQSRPTFTREILPGLREKPVRELVQATGLTRQYCGRIRKGKCVPHPRHWVALRRLAAPAANAC